MLYFTDTSRNFLRMFCLSFIHIGRTREDGIGVKFHIQLMFLVLISNPNSALMHSQWAVWMNQCLPLHPPSWHGLVEHPREEMQIIKGFTATFTAIWYASMFIHCVVSDTVWNADVSLFNMYLAGTSCWNLLSCSLLTLTFEQEVNSLLVHSNNLHIFLQPTVSLIRL